MDVRDGGDGRAAVTFKVYDADNSDKGVSGFLERFRAIIPDADVTLPLPLMPEWRAAFAEFLRVCSLYHDSNDYEAAWWVGLTGKCAWLRDRPWVDDPDFAVAFSTPVIAGEGLLEFMSPAAARRLATVLLAAADEAERR